MDRLEAMNLFVRVAEKGSFSAVAEQLDLPRSVVTRKIAALEAHLGTKLIARSTRSLSLTAAGQNYLEQAREVLALVDAAETGLDAERGKPRGLIRAGLPLSFGIKLMPLLADFAADYPDISLELDFTDRRAYSAQPGHAFQRKLDSHSRASWTVLRRSAGRLIFTLKGYTLSKRRR
ncbi:MAG: LysR family transcriptional regulator, partial [Rhodocyclaceae bacterium]|nr:LysR family transcriptional regulator [Rhodocyclaceae bacterium]